MIEEGPARTAGPFPLIPTVPSNIELTMQTILGSGGAIGTDLARALRKYTNDIRLVSRTPKKVNDADILHPADLTDPAQIQAAVDGSEVCYVTIAFEYTADAWREHWPPFIERVVASCGRAQSKLVFFDNIYAIGGDNVRHITEDSPISPTSRKGEIRARLDRLIMESVERGTVQAIIARAPDFFGTKKATSMTMNLIYDNLAKGKAAQWLCNADVPHSTGYVPDLALGTAMLGNTPDAFNQVWNLPTDSTAPTGREWAAMFARELGVSGKVQVLPVWGMRALGLFIPVMREIYEMRYQYDRPYVFDSSKFSKRFNMIPTPNAEAVRQTVAALRALEGTSIRKEHP
jgi:nucleoside-diphosphate-sugar epimerase